MEFSQEDFERLLFAEQARKTAEDTYSTNPLDADVRAQQILLSMLGSFGFVNYNRGEVVSSTNCLCFGICDSYEKMFRSTTLLSVIPPNKISTCHLFTSNHPIKFKEVDMSNFHLGGTIDKMIFDMCRNLIGVTINDWNLTKWGGALLEISQYQNVAESKNTMNDAISKFEEALVIDPNKADTLCCAGNAYTSIGFLTPDKDEAKTHFNKATAYFQRAADAEPSNDMYSRSLEMAAKAPELHMEIHKQAFGEQIATKGSFTASSAKSSKKKKKKKDSDLKYDVFGWIILAVGIVAWVGMAKSHAPPPPPK